MLNFKLCITVACNDERILTENLLASDVANRDDVDVLVSRNVTSIAATYNRLLDQSSADVIVFSHQDVYFPPDWVTRLATTIAALEKNDPDWAVLSPTGISMDREHVGTIWSSSQGARIGRQVSGPVPVQSVDEAVIILRRKSGIRFDEKLPGFHFYGTDIVQTARASNLGAYVGHLPIIHNDKAHLQLGEDFERNYRFIQRKWVTELPLKTTVLSVNRTGMAWKIYKLRAKKSTKARANKAVDPTTDPKVFSEMCGWEMARDTR